MGGIQKLYEVCKGSLSEKGPISSEAIDKVRVVLGKNYYLPSGIDIIFRKSKLEDTISIRTKQTSMEWEYNLHKACFCHWHYVLVVKLKYCEKFKRHKHDSWKN